MIGIILIVIFILALCWGEWDIVRLLSPFAIAVVFLIFVVGIPTLRDNLRK